MHKEIVIYVDDMVAKSRLAEEHVDILCMLFKRLQKFQLKFNTAKYIFEASSKKLLGFLLGKKELKPPKTQKEVKRFLDNLNYIALFISTLLKLGSQY